MKRITTKPAFWQAVRHIKMLDLSLKDKFEESKRELKAVGHPAATVKTILSGEDWWLAFRRDQFDAKVTAQKRSGQDDLANIDGVTKPQRDFLHANGIHTKQDILACKRVSNFLLSVPVRGQRCCCSPINGNPLICSGTQEAWKKLPWRPRIGMNLEFLKKKLQD